MKSFKEYIKEKNDPMITHRKKIDAAGRVPTRSGAKGGSASGNGGGGNGGGSGGGAGT